MEIDVAALAKRALQDRQPGEDLDESLLRACKQLYGDTGLMAFAAIRSGLSAIASTSKVDLEAALQQAASGHPSTHKMFVTTTETGSSRTLQPLESLPPEIREEVERSIAAGKTRTATTSGHIVIRRSGSFSEMSPAASQSSRCVNCGYERPADSLVCPQCGHVRQRSWWQRLLGL